MTISALRSRKREVRSIQERTGHLGGTGGVGVSPPISGFLPGDEQQRIERYRHMPPGEKFKEIAALNRLRTEQQCADIRARYGDIPDQEMRMRLGVLRLGREMMVKMFGHAALVCVLDRGEESDAS